MEKLPKLLIKTTGGRFCRVEFERSSDSIAAKITWAGDSTPEDRAEVDAVLMAAIEPHLAPGAHTTSVDMGYAPQSERDAAVKRFLKSGEN